MEFSELIEARRSVRKYVASEISEAEVEEIIALGKAEGAAVKPPRKPVGEVVKTWEVAQGHVWHETLR